MDSPNDLTWKAHLDLRTCTDCRDLHGKVYEQHKPIQPAPPLHTPCRCAIRVLEAVFAGRATKRGMEGADWWLKNRNRLPNYYLNEQEAQSRGWKAWIGNLANVAPGMMLAKGIYENRNAHLPIAPGRFWYEADINYTTGRRGLERIVYSNDGLIFVTYDHYLTFIEIL